MQREEKHLEATLQAIQNRVIDLKTAIQALITKLETEYETINWPTFLDNYAILSGHVSYNKQFTPAISYHKHNLKSLFEKSKH